MILVFDVGNTETTIGLFDGDELIDHWRIATRQDDTVDELGLLVRSLVRESGFDLTGIRATMIASVVPPLTPSLIEMSERHLGVPAGTVDAHSPLPIRLEVEEPLSVGADRIANTIAVASLFRTNTIAVDLGTATTFDCISGAGAFLGGIIAPGVQSGAETLVRRTAKLPRVDLEPPASVIGRRTETALQSGIFYTAIETIDGIVNRIKAEWDRPGILVIATGGLAPLLAPHCRTVDRVEPFLTLYGLEIAYRQIEDPARGLRRAAIKAPRGGRLR
jgi:type III pantothenate kinase